MKTPLNHPPRWNLNFDLTTKGVSASTPDKVTCMHGRAIQPFPQNTLGCCDYGMDMPNPRRGALNLRYKTRVVRTCAQPRERTSTTGSGRIMQPLKLMPWWAEPTGYRSSPTGAGGVTARHQPSRLRLILVSFAFSLTATTPTAPRGRSGRSCR